jgi:NUMOD4 motif/HNH endonuclease
MCDDYIDVDDPDWCEFWIEIEDNRKYEVSSRGRVRNYMTRRVLVQSVDKQGYFHLTLGPTPLKNYRVNRLVAMNFIDNPLNKPVVNHLNGIKKDNRLCNLEWASHSENAQHAHDTGLSNSRHLRKPIKRATIDGTDVVHFESVTTAAREMNCPLSDISRVLVKRNWTARGYRWYFEDEEIDKTPYLRNEDKMISVVRISRDGKERRKYHSISEAARDVGGFGANISKVLAGDRKTAYKYRWEYDD